MKKQALVILADGFEEIEAVTPIDVLRRAGVEVTVAGLKNKLVKGSRGVQIKADVVLDAVKCLPDVLVLPGGGLGAKNLGESKQVKELIKKMDVEKRLIAAICAAPAYVLMPAGVLEGKRATCFPGCEDQFSSAVKFSEDRVVVDGNVITSRAPGTALEFAFAIVEKLVSREETSKLRQQMLVK